MSAVWEITFTSAFQQDLGRVPKDIFGAIDRIIAFLREDPFARIPNAKRLKGARHRFRARIADRFRLLYQVFSKERRVTLVKLGDRQDIYEGTWPDARPIGALPPETPLFDIPARSKAPVPTRADQEPGPSVASVEPIKWISQDELFLLRIPEAHWAEVLTLTDADGLDRTSLPQHIRARITDYVTSSASSQLGKLYGLSDDAGAESIAGQPLENFLLALDPEQRRVVQLPASGGPYLVKGGPGTGKTLVGLYRLKQMVESRAAEDVFSSGTPVFGCLTYTNTLVGAMQALLQPLLPSSGDYRLHVSTLDKLTRELAQASLGRKQFTVWKDPSIDGCIQSIIRDYSASPSTRLQEIAAALGSLGVAYVREEILLVIQANNVTSLEEYSGFPRAGRKRPFSSRIRETFWAFYEAFERRRRQARAETWGSLRQLALAHLKATPGFPKFNFLFVDEVQDLSRVARQLCVELIKDVRFLFLTADTGQSIYIHPPTWAETDPRLRLTGRTFPLRRNYRTTRQIADAIAPLRKETDDGLEQTGLSAAVFTGVLPRWHCLPMKKHLTEVVRLVNELAQRQGVNAGQIAIVLREREQLQRYLPALKEAKIPAALVDKDKPISLRAAHVHLLLAHSSKGLEFPIVIAPEISDAHFPLAKVVTGAKDDGELQEALEKERRLLYVALSRACSQLYLLVDEAAPSRFLDELRPQDWVRTP